MQDVKGIVAAIAVAIVGSGLVAAAAACNADTTRPAWSSGEPADAGLVPPAAAADESAGAKLVAARGCPMCHQPQDADAGVLSGQTTPRPGTRSYGANLTPDDATGLGRWSDDEVLRAIRTGVDDEGAPLCPPMPHFIDMDDAEGEAIVGYLRSLAPVRRAIPESRCEGDDGDDASDTAPDGDAPPPDDAGLATVAPDGDTQDGANDGSACTMIAPGVTASCHGCSDPWECNPNGCYGGYWCDPTTWTCHHRPASCP